MSIRTGRHSTPAGIEWHAIDENFYDGGDVWPVMGIGWTREEALADLAEQIDALLCPECKSGPGEEHSIHCSLEHGP